MRLTEAKAKHAKPQDRDYKLTDGGGLYLHVTVTGGKLWRWKYRFLGKEKLMSFGPYPSITISEARERRGDALKLLREGKDPMAQRKADKAAARVALGETFEAVTLAWHRNWKVGKNEEYANDVMTRITRDLFPPLGNLGLEQIDAPMIVAVAKKIEDRGAPEVARRSIGNIGQVFRYAIAHGLARRNPASDVKPADFLNTRKMVNYARIEASELPMLLRKIETYEGTPITRLAMRLMALTFVRTSELIGAQWSEFDFKIKRWIIPAERMKGTKYPSPHIVPLSDQALDVLEMIRGISGKSPYLFPGAWVGVRTMSNNTILKALERMGYKGDMTGHGFRGLASTILNEHDFNEKHIDLQLAHLKRNRVSAAYDHAKHLKQRTEMMQWWADYLDRSRKERPSTGLVAAG